MSQRKNKEDKEEVEKSSAVLHLEECLDEIETLPTTIQKSLKTVKDLDRKSLNTETKADDLADAYLRNVRSLSPQKRTAEISKIKEVFKEGLECGKKKIKVVDDVYDMLDKNIVDMDIHLKQLEREIKAKSSWVEGRPTKEQTYCKAKHATRDHDQMAVELEEQNLNVLEMAIDPNEPTFCLCNQVSYDNMIGCDNDDCPIEWFHFACVGLTEQPQGKWYCPNCTRTSRRGKKSGRKDYRE